MLSVPFFSLDKLLAATEAVGEDAPAAVRAAYLDEVPWRTRESRERAFDLAMCLAPIRYAYADREFTYAVGWGEEPLAKVTAWWLQRALARWKQTESSTPSLS